MLLLPSLIIITCIIIIINIIRKPIDENNSRVLNNDMVKSSMISTIPNTRILSDSIKSCLHNGGSSNSMLLGSAAGGGASGGIYSTYRHHHQASILNITQVPNLSNTILVVIVVVGNIVITIIIRINSLLY